MKSACPIELAVLFTMLVPRGMAAHPSAPAASAASNLPSYAEVKDFCQEFEGIVPPDAPVDEVFVGTFDALTSQFTWAVGAILRDLPPYVPPWSELAPGIEDSIRLKNLFDHLGIRAIRSGLNSAMVRQQIRPDLARPRPPRAGLEDRRFANLPVVAAPTGEAPSKKAYHVRAHGGELLLRFRVVNRPSNVPFHVVVSIPMQLGGGGAATSEVTGTPGDESAYLLIPPVGYVSFSVSVGPNEFEDPVGFLRPPALGCFTLEALPVSIVYEPPGSNSSQSYTVAEQVGTTIRTFVTGESATTEPDHVPFFTEAQQFSDALKGVGSAVGFAYPSLGKGMQAAGEALKKVFGSASETTTISHEVTEDHALLVRETNTTNVTTGLHLGPGRGDRFHVLINPTFAWLAAQDEETGGVFLSIVLLGFEIEGRTSAEDLRVGTPPLDAVIPPETRQALLEVDPFTGFELPSNQNPAPTRFAPLDHDILYTGPGPFTYELERTLQESYTHIEKVVKTRTREEESGLLSYIASGTPTTGSKSLRTVEGSATGYLEQTTAVASVTLNTAFGEGLLLRPYFDTLYGTFAYVPLPWVAPEITG